MNPWAPLDATVPSVSSPTNAHTVKPDHVQARQRLDELGLLLRARARSSPRRARARLPGPSDPSSSLDVRAPGSLRRPIGGAAPARTARSAARGWTVSRTRGPCAPAARPRGARGARRTASASVVLDAALQRGLRRRADAAVQLAQLGQARGRGRRAAAHGSSSASATVSAASSCSAASRRRPRRRPGARAGRAPRRPARRRGPPSSAPRRSCGRSAASRRVRAATARAARAP